MKQSKKHFTVFILLLIILVLGGIATSFYKKTVALPEKPVLLPESPGNVEEDLPEAEKPEQEKPQPVIDPDDGFAGGSGPVAYLTFDDGPSQNTLQILEILAEYKVTATFFVTGNNSSGDSGIYRRILHEGHVLGNHTFSHNFDNIYLSDTHFITDFQRLEDFLFQEAGVRTHLMRFPGGSKSSMALKVSGYDIIADLIPEVTKRGYDYFDWNVSSGDGTATPPKEDIIKNVLDQADEINGDIVVLFHDSPAKITTVEALPETIQGLLARGYEFAVLDRGVINSKHKQ